MISVLCLQVEFPPDSLRMIICFPPLCSFHHSTPCIAIWAKIFPSLPWGGANDSWASLSFWCLVEPYCAPHDVGYQPWRWVALEEGQERRLWSRVVLFRKCPGTSWEKEVADILQITLEEADLLNNLGGSKFWVKVSAEIKLLFQEEPGT